MKKILFFLLLTISIQVSAQELYFSADKETVTILKTYLNKISSHSSIEVLSPISDENYLIKVNKSEITSLSMIKKLKQYKPFIDLEIPISFDETIKVRITAMPDLNELTISQYLDDIGIRAIRFDHHGHTAFAEISNSQLSILKEQSWLRFIFLSKPSKKESILGASLGRANIINSTGSGLSYDGKGVNVLVRDQDGELNHIDFTGRLSDLGPTQSVGNHSNNVAGTLAGANNLSPFGGGVAPGAHIFNIANNNFMFDNTLSLHVDSNVVVTNTSYTDGCNTYDDTSAFLDDMLINNPKLMHVFSAGNLGVGGCGGSGPWYNITGGDKMAKNVLTVASVKGDGSVEPTSSDGPANDGRIKPDITAHGANEISQTYGNGYEITNGTSIASPQIAGAVAQLTHVYKDLYNQEPNQDLLKCVLLNSSDDIGNPGPDFTYGWGLLNIKNAYQILKNEHITKILCTESA